MRIMHGGLPASVRQRKRRYSLFSSQDAPQQIDAHSVARRFAWFRGAIDLGAGQHHIDSYIVTLWWQLPRPRVGIARQQGRLHRPADWPGGAGELQRDGRRDDQQAVRERSMSFAGQQFGVRPSPHGHLPVPDCSPCLLLVLSVRGTGPYNSARGPAETAPALARRNRRAEC